MRSQQFLQFLQANYNPQIASALASTPGIRGGWEVWLQVEIARTFLALGGNRVAERERPYPSGVPFNQYLTYNNATHAVGTSNNAAHAAKCDFYLHRQDGLADETYLELKTINPNVPNPLFDAWGRFWNDVQKIQALQGANNVLNYIAVLATYGTFSQNDINSLAWVWAGGRTAYVWDPVNNAVTTLQNVAQNGNARFFIVAASI